MARDERDETDRSEEQIRPLCAPGSDIDREGASEHLCGLQRRPTGDRAERIQRALAAAGAFSSGVPDLAENHDKYLEEVYDS